MAVLITLLLSLAPVQDDVSKWIGQLESDSIEQRDEATRRLQTQGVDAIPRLEKARDAAADTAVRSRLDAIIAAIRKSAELAKVFGPTRRVTIAARGKLIKEVLGELKAPGIKGIDPGMLDVESRIDLQVRNVTWWEALDRVSRARKSHYQIRYDDGDYTILLKPGMEPESPVFYFEQFRISVAETKRVELITPAGKVERAMVAIEVRHQADLRSSSYVDAECVKIKSILDDKGADALVEREGPDERLWEFDHPLLLSYQANAWVRPDAPLPLTVTGITDMPFVSQTQEIELDLGGARSRVQVGKVRLSVEKFSQTGTGARLMLRAEAEEEKEGEESEEKVPWIMERLDSASDVVLVDGAGRRHVGSRETSQGGGNRCAWEIVFSTGIEKPKRVVFRWVSEIHLVEIPFRLEGVRLPERSK